MSFSAVWFGLLLMAVDFKVQFADASTSVIDHYLEKSATKEKSKASLYEDLSEEELIKLVEARNAEIAILETSLARYENEQKEETDMPTALQTEEHDVVINGVIDAAPSAEQGTSPAGSKPLRSAGRMGKCQKNAKNAVSALEVIQQESKDPEDASSSTASSQEEKGQEEVDSQSQEQEAEEGEPVGSSSSVVEKTQRRKARPSLEDIMDDSVEKMTNICCVCTKCTPTEEQWKNFAVYEYPWGECPGESTVKKMQGHCAWQKAGAGMDATADDIGPCRMGGDGKCYKVTSPPKVSADKPYGYNKDGWLPIIPNTKNQFVGSPAGANPQGSGPGEPGEPAMVLQEPDERCQDGMYRFIDDQFVSITWRGVHGDEKIKIDLETGQASNEMSKSRDRSSKKRRTVNDFSKLSDRGRGPSKEQDQWYQVMFDNEGDEEEYPTDRNWRCIKRIDGEVVAFLPKKWADCFEDVSGSSSSMLNVAQNSSETSTPAP